MTRTSLTTTRSLREERGQGLVEYALILALVSLAAIVALGFLSGKINTLFSKAGNSLNTVAVADGSGTGGTATGGTATGGTATGGTATGGGSAPATPTITAGPVPDSSGSSAAFTSPTFQFTGDGTQTAFQCSLDLASFTTCTSPQGYSGLGVGPHSFRVQASNGNGTSSPATRNWTVTAASTPPSYVSGGNLGGCTPNCDDGENITVSASTWNGNPTPTLSYQWKVNGDSGDAGACNFSDGGWSNVGSNSTTFNLPNPSGNGTDSVGVRITATNSAGTATRDVCTRFDH